MLLDRPRQLAFLHRRAPWNPDTLLQIDFATGRRTPLTDYADYEVLDWCGSAGRLALNSPWLTARGTNRTRLVVLDVTTGEVLHDSTDHLVHRAAFGATGGKLLLEVHRPKPLCLDLDTKALTPFGKPEVYLYKGTLVPGENAFVIPAENKKATAWRYDFAAGQLSTHKLPVKELIGHIQFCGSRNVFLASTHDDVLHCLSADIKEVIWTLDFAALADKPSQIWSSSIHLSEDAALAYVSAPSTAEHSFGVDYAVSLDEGRIVAAHPGYKGRGRIAAPWFGTEVLLYTGHVMDMVSGVVGELVA